MALYWASGSGTAFINPADPAITPILTAPGVGQGDGKFNAGIATTGAGTPPGGTAEFEVVGWTGSYPPYAQALAANALVGSSSTFENATGGAGSQATTMTGWNGNLLLRPGPVPEPATVAVGLLGAGALLFARRRGSWR